MHAPLVQAYRVMLTPDSSSFGPFRYCRSAYRNRSWTMADVMEVANILESAKFNIGNCSSFAQRSAQSLPLEAPLLPPYTILSTLREGLGRTCYVISRESM